MPYSLQFITILTDLGINEDNIRVEEFTGFNPNEIDNITTDHVWGKHILLVVIAL